MTGSGRPETVVEVGPINRVRVSGTKLFYAMSSGCWISKVDASQATPTPATNDRSVYSDSKCDPEGGPSVAGFEVTDDKIAIVRTSGEVMLAKHDGSGLKKIGELRIGNWGDLIESHALADGNVFMLTVNHLTDAQNHPVKPAIYKLKMSSSNAASSAPEKVFEPAGKVAHLTSDGKNLYWSEENKVMKLAAGSSTPVQVADAFGEITDLAADGPNLFVADSGRGAIYIVRDAAGAAPQPKKKLANAKGITSLIAKDNKVYFGSHVIENRRAAGIIGSIAVP